MRELILGIHIGHDSSLTLLDKCSGRILYAEEEERPKKQKNYFGLPEISIKNALKQLRAASDEIIGIAVGWNMSELENSRISFYKEALENGNTQWGQEKSDNMTKIKEYARQLTLTFPNAGIWEVDHHLAHALSVLPFHQIANFKTIPALIMDAVGEFSSVSVYRSLFKDKSILLEWPIRASVGYFYQRWAEVMGFRGRQACGYLMSLAAYGDKKRYLDMLFDGCVGKSPEGLPWVSPENFNPMAGHGDTANRCFPTALIASLELLTQAKDPMEKADLAAAVQTVTEEIVMGLVHRLRNLVESEELIISGGVFLNCAVNQMLKNSGIFKRTFMGPAANDSGVSIGAALYGWMKSMNFLPGSIPPASPFLGTIITGEEEIWKELKETYPGVTIPEDISRAVAKDLLNGLSVAIADGPLEFGPRALGARSILADPANKKMTNLLNSIKVRYTFQPIAASMTIPAAQEFFNLITPEPYMTILYKGTAQAESQIPAAIYVDGTCRLHTVDGKEPHLLFKILEELANHGRPAVVLNTSFNRKGRALPANANDAIIEYCILPVDILYTSKMRVKLSGEEKESCIECLKAKGESHYE